MVGVRPDLPDVIRRLVAGLEWRTSGKGKKFREETMAETLATGAPIAGGEAVEFPFEFDAPLGPPSYEGKALNVEWRLAVRAEFEKAKAIEAVTPFDLLPDGKGVDPYLGPETKEVEEEKPGRGGFGSPLFFGCGTFMLLTGGLGVFVALSAWSSEGIGIKIVSVVMGLIFFPIALLGLISYRWALAGIPARLKLGRVDWSAVPGKLRRAESLTLTLQLRPRRDVIISKIEAKLTAREEVEDGKGKDHEEEILVKTIRVSEERRVIAGEEVRLERTIASPSDGPWTIAAPDNHLDWELEVSMTLEGHGADWSAERKILVLP